MGDTSGGKKEEVALLLQIDDEREGESEWKTL